MSIKRVLLLLLISILIFFLGLFVFFKKELVIIYEQIKGGQNISVYPSFRAYINKVHSPDGAKKLVIATKEEEGAMPTHMFSTADISGINKKNIFETKALKEDVWISPNAWSPDNKYFYILKKEKGVVSALVFKADGDLINGLSFINILPIFNKKTKVFDIADVTGWDSPNLLHVTTVEKDTNKRGPSFWFDIESLVFLQLFG